MPADPAPAIAWLNRQRAVAPAELGLRVAALVVDRALPGVLAAVRSRSVLGQLPEVSVVAVSDRRIAAVHGEFLGDPTPTDVITFLHGEIVLSAETAQREAFGRGLPLPQEIARYAVHGLLHLAGWSDETPSDAAEMRSVQEKILRRAIRGLC
ncbi:MAG: rRNA maturation RNase YbeY [Chthoniobacterales bacterium]|nr:rRNA maturation RNase YbeY [Chthoniobacterales bacterium]